MTKVLNASDAFLTFARAVLAAPRAQRLITLAASSKGRAKILKGLDHDLERAILPKAVKGQAYGNIWDEPCFVFSGHHGFGVEFTSVREAYEGLSLFDGWIILLRDGSAGIYPPEAPWGAGETLLSA